MDIVAKKGGIVSYNDSFIPIVKTNHGAVYHSVLLTKETLDDADVVVLTTNHSTFDIAFIQKYSKLIMDIRNMVK